MEQCAWNSSNTENPRSRLGSAGFSYCLYRFRLAVSFADSPHHARAPWAGRSCLSTATQPWMPVIALPAAGTFFVSCRLSNVAPTMTSISWSSTVVHNQHGVGEIACHGVRLIHAVLAEDDHRAIHLLGVVVRRLGVELAVLQRVAHRLGEAGELRAVEHTQRDCCDSPHTWPCCRRLP